MAQPPKQIWKDAFEKGIALYKVQSYDEALIAFGEAVKTGGKRVVVLDSRAVVLEKLGRFKEALQDARAVIELTPTSPKGYFRSSHLFELLNRIPQAHQMLLLAIPLSSPAALPSLQARRTVLEDKLALYHKSKTNHIQTLPAEILTYIGHLVVELDADIALKLAAVSLHWRGVFLNDARIWGRLKVGRKRALPKAKIFWERSKGRLVELDMDGAPIEGGGKVLEMVSESFERLRVFRWRLEEPSDVVSYLQRWRGSFANLRQFRLELWPRDARVASNLDMHDVWNLLRGPCVLEHLDLRNLSTTSLAPPSHLGSVSSIKHVHLSSYCLINTPSSSDDNDLSHFLDLLPNLETLSLPASKGRFNRSPDHRTSDVVLLSLRRLDVPGAAFALLGPISMPLLERADFSCLNWPSFNVLIPHNPLTGEPSDVNVRNLTHLNITRVAVVEGLASDYFTLMPKLTHLSLACCNLTNTTVANLVLTCEGEGLLPLLEHLDLSYLEQITGGPVCRLVASRKGRGREGKGLRSLVLDGCPLIEDKAVEWLKGKVERFSCRIVLEKKKR